MGKSKQNINKKANHPISSISHPTATANKANNLPITDEQSKGHT